MSENDIKIARRRRYIKEALAIVFGTFICACGVALFANPAKITGGGVTGIGTILYYTFGLDQGLVMILANIPIIIAGIIFFGWSYGLKVTIGAVMLSFWISLLGQATNYQGFLDYSDSVNVLLSAVAYGVINGLGSGIALRSGINFGGSTVIAQIVAAKTPYPVGTVDLIINACVLTAGSFFFGLSNLMLSFIASYLLMQAVNFVSTGFGTKLAKTAYVFSNSKTEEISKRVVKDLGHGGTVFDGTGIYSSADRKMLVVVIPNHQMQEFVNIINEEDPTAFVFVVETYQALGTGFMPLSKVVTDKKKKITQNKA